MELNRANRIVLEIAVLVMLCGLILSAALVTLFQIDQDMIAKEAPTQTGSLLRSHG
jgi:Na+-transporting NADH:ubiquinone oxidoreductase subunit NqrC